MNKTITTIVVIAVLVVGGVLVFSSGDSGSQEDTTGTVYFSITDAAADMSTISEVEMNVDSVQLHSQSDGWVDAGDDDKSFRLLELDANGETKLYTKADVAARTYDQIRLVVDGVQVSESENGTSSQETTLPSDEITITGNVVVEENATSSVTLDVMADQSLHVTDEGEYVFAPVISVESRSNATVTVGENDTVTVTGGNVTTDIVVGADVDGTMKSNFKLDSSSGINIGSGGTIEIIGTSTTTGSTDTETEVDSETQGEVDVSL